MTLKQFFERLPKDGWSIECLTCIRRHGFTCPVCASANRRGVAWWLSYTTIGISCNVAGRIARAADGGDFISPTERRIRRLLLAHCGLNEPT